MPEATPDNLLTIVHRRLIEGDKGNLKLFKPGVQYIYDRIVDLNQTSSNVALTLVSYDPVSRTGLYQYTTAADFPAGAVINTDINNSSYSANTFFHVHDIGNNSISIEVVNNGDVIDTDSGYVSVADNGTIIEQNLPSTIYEAEDRCCESSIFYEITCNNEVFRLSEDDIVDVTGTICVPQEYQDFDVAYNERIRINDDPDFDAIRMKPNPDAIADAWSKVYL